MFIEKTVARGAGAAHAQARIGVALRQAPRRPPRPPRAPREAGARRRGGRAKPQVLEERRLERSLLGRTRRVRLVRGEGRGVSD